MSEAVDSLRAESFTILSRLQSGTEEVVRLDAALAAVAAAVAAERERCAKLCDQMMGDSYTEMHLGGEPADAADCAAAIRAAP